MRYFVTDEKFNTSVKFWIGSWIVGLLFPIMTSKMPHISKSKTSLIL